MEDVALVQRLSGSNGCGDWVEEQVVFWVVVAMWCWLLLAVK